MERAVVLARGDEILPEDLLLEETIGLAAPPGDAANAIDGAARGGGVPIPPGSETLQERLDRAAAEQIRTALATAHGQRAVAARALGVERTTLYRMMKRFGIE
jgi:DNA-binding NtrC family response regulator